MKAEGTIRKTAWGGALATLFTALLFNACCWLPPVLIAITGSGAGYLSFLEPWKPYLLAFTAVQLSFGLYMAYRKPHSKKHKCDPSHNHEASRRINIRIMWGVVVVVICLNAWDFVKDHSVKTPATRVATRP
jgi:mercuric ion transport protein